MAGSGIEALARPVVFGAVDCFGVLFIDLMNLVTEGICGRRLWAVLFDVGGFVPGVGVGCLALGGMVVVWFG